MIRRSLQYLLAGAVLCGVGELHERLVDPAVISLQVDVEAGAPDPEVERIVEEAILLDHTLRMGWHEQDRVIHGHLATVMQFALDGELGSDPQALVREAERLGMLRQDAVVRARILQKARFILSSLAEDDRPSDAQLERYAEARPGSYRRAGDLRFAHVYVSRAGDGDPQERASVLLEKLRIEDPEPAEAFRLGDALLRARPVESRSLPGIRRSYGEAFAREIREAAPGQWVGPLESAFGAHLVKVLERREDRPARLDEIRNQVLGDYMKQLKLDRYAERFERVRGRYEVTVVRRTTESV